MHHPQILVMLCLCLGTALVLGYITHRLRLSPLLGYLIAGVLLGPNTPGLEANLKMATDMAHIGVILLMFGVGLHFNLRDLWAVRRTAVPGAVGQILVATVAGAVVMVLGGWTWGAGLVIGVAVSVASTVVLIRVLTDNNVLESSQGHIAIGWLIVEDLFTVLVLVVLPALAPAIHGEQIAPLDIGWSLLMAIAKIVALSIIVLWGGRRLIPYILTEVARTRTQELFTLTILVLALAVATGSAVIFGVSMELGAFLAGMVVGQSKVSHQAGVDALPMRDAFAVLFFVSVGMLLKPQVLMAHPFLFVGLLGVILVAKPLAALGIVWALGHSVRTALTVSVALAQIGEFSFILAELAKEHKLLNEDGLSLLVACAICSIALNPLVFRLVGPLEASLRRRPRLWALLNRRAEARAKRGVVKPLVDETTPPNGRAIIVGYGPVGRTAAGILKEFGVQPVVVDLNIDTVNTLLEAGELAVFGDATRRDILSAAGTEQASYLLVTVPDIETRTVVILAASELNPQLKVFVRARYLEERAWLEEIGATGACFEEAEAAIGLSTLLLHEMGASDERIEKEQQRIRRQGAFRAELPANE
ncbi:MAG: cation:proton antiporter [Planctomycetes bacterium]|nr:cation:proton antiporter [Planctomycetota bacterium]